MEVTIIKPNCSVEQALERNGLSADKDAIRVLGFPKHLYEFDVEIKRRVLENRKITMSTTIDLLTGTSIRNDVYPDLESQSFLPESLLNPRVDESRAAEKAHSQVRRRTNSWYKTFRTPQITLRKEDQAFKLFWLVPDSTTSTVTILDSITGQITGRDIRPDNVSQIEFTS